MSRLLRARQLALAALMAFAITVVPMSAGAESGKARGTDNPQASSSALDPAPPAGGGSGRKAH